MCNKYGYNSPLHRLIETFKQVDLPFDRPPLANFPALEEINPTDTAPIVRRGARGVELTTMRWGFPPPRPKAGPIVNFRSEGRAFTTGRCLIPATHFFEFTGTRYPKIRWRFTMPGEDFFCIAGLYRGASEEARFTMLTIPPGPDVALYHDRQIVPLAPRDWRAWLDPLAPTDGVLVAGAAGTLAVERVN
ncbi:MAG: SOS response-associated peptidase family protein [Pseudomonadota bacterium]|nr:SOS response-associated peptidase family protein [Pseudomonadota bacterium]